MLFFFFRKWLRKERGVKSTKESCLKCRPYASYEVKHFFERFMRASDPDRISDANPNSDPDRKLAMKDP
jgi:hypothetical protein